MNINHSLSHRGVTFSIVRETTGDEPPIFRWSVHADTGAAGGGGGVEPSGIVEGRRAFAGAHKAAVAAINEMRRATS